MKEDTKKELKKLGTYAILFGCCFLGGRWAAAKQAMHAQPTQQTAKVVVDLQTEETKETKEANQGKTLQNTKTCKLAIVIDDFGYGGEGEEEMLALDVPFTGAVLPFAENAEAIAQKLADAGKEVYIHMPMEALTGHPEWVGKDGIFCSMTDEEITIDIARAFEILPQATGVNNHMGSAILEDKRATTAVLTAVKEQDVPFLDSKTTANSQAKAVAEGLGVTFYARDVFLDSTDSVEVVKGNLRQAAKVALESGQAIAIGHVGPEGGKITAQAIAELKSELDEQGIVFVTMEDL